MFAILTSSRRHSRTNHAVRTNTGRQAPAVETLEGRVMLFNPEIGDFTTFDPILGVPTLFGYPTTGGAISGVLGTEVSNLWSSATPRASGSSSRA